MPDFETFRMDKVLVGQSFVFRQTNPCLDEIGKNNPKINKNIKCTTIYPIFRYPTHTEWLSYIRQCGKIEINKK